MFMFSSMLGLTPIHKNLREEDTGTSNETCDQMQPHQMVELSFQMLACASVATGSAMPDYSYSSYA